MVKAASVTKMPHPSDNRLHPSADIWILSRWIGSGSRGNGMSAKRPNDPSAATRPACGVDCGRRHALVAEVHPGQLAGDPLPAHREQAPAARRALARRAVVLRRRAPAPPPGRRPGEAVPGELAAPWFRRNRPLAPCPKERE